MNNNESRHFPAEQGGGEGAALEYDENSSEGDVTPGTESTESFGHQLQAAREALDLDVSNCGRSLHLPAHLLRKLEADDYESIDYSVYLRSYLDKYATHLGIEPERIQAQLESLQPKQPKLIATHHVSPWQRLFNRYSSALTYVVLTVVLIVPLVWLGLSGGFKHDMAKLAPLDAAPVGTRSSALESGAREVTSNHVIKHQPKTKADTNEKPLMASMTPLSAMENVDADLAPAQKMHPAGVPQSAMQSAKHLTLKLNKHSWVQITDSAGKRLEYALLPAGTDKSYSSEKPLDIRIGNAGSAQVTVDGKPLTLEPFQHANVAHFKLDKNGSAKPDNS